MSSHQTSLQRVQDIAQADALSDDDIARPNDVTRVLNQSSKGRRLLSLAIQQLRNNG